MSLIQWKNSSSSCSRSWLELCWFSRVSWVSDVDSHAVDDLGDNKHLCANNDSIVAHLDFTRGHVDRLRCIGIRREHGGDVVESLHICRPVIRGRPVAWRSFPRSFHRRRRCEVCWRASGCLLAGGLPGRLGAQALQAPDIQAFGMGLLRFGRRLRDRARAWCHPARRYSCRPPPNETEDPGWPSSVCSGSQRRLECFGRHPCPAPNYRPFIIESKSQIYTSQCRGMGCTAGPAQIRSMNLIRSDWLSLRPMALRLYS